VVKRRKEEVEGERVARVGVVEKLPVVEKRV
jgi:hypothetical protein